ncbi:efflux RND transporter permease subunit [Chenggangzhangella methanolivorans]|uniref:Efflux RND transporter permease subunit n=1 Tax=Chenggangzhangella methanolivorans TaxID=1437009 RepID=A0A9E6UQX3_9HYPH|nr:efflux RND transporter permease subunit [Chenggangzhangella methanolivorans]QZO01610.1 efflux RND transporter permease subunit [Chenggangzhangella methanolivorans]
MALNVSAWAIRKPIPSLVLFVVLVAIGAASFMTLPVTRMPNIDLPLVSVTIMQDGAAPSELELQVTKRVETSVAGLSGVKHITSTVNDGVSVTVIEFQLETSVDRAVNDVRDAVTKIRTELPQSIEEPLIQRIDIEGMPISTYAASAPAMTPEELSWFIDDRVIRQLQSVRGVAQVKREGGVDREVRVSLDPARLQALGITAAEVNAQLRATNVDLAGGRGEVGTQEQSVRTLAGALSVEKLAQTRIVLPGGRQAPLSELGSVRDGSAEPRISARLDGKPIVAFGVYRAKGFSDVVVAAAVEEKLAELQQARPDVQISRIDTTVRYTEGDYRSAMHTLLEGAALAVVVVFLFLRDWRATLITALAIPLSILPTFWVMSALGFSLNAVSLLAITLVTGILVDDAIVEIENIVRHMRMGKSPYRAAIEAADEIGLAVVATTATIVAVFMPVSFMGGIAGQYFKQFGITVAVAVAFSLLVARLITPLLAAYFLRDHGAHEERDGWVMRGYTAMLRWCVRWRFVTVLAGFAIFAGSIVMAGYLPSGFLPENDTSRSILKFELPPGARLEQSDGVANRITAMLKSRPEVLSVYATAGSDMNGGQSTTGEVRKGVVIVNLKPKRERNLTQKQFEAEMRRQLASIPDLRTNFGNEGGQREFAMIVSGQDGEAVEKAAVAIEQAVRQKVPGLLNVISTAAIDRPEIRIEPKLDEAAELGVSVFDIAETVRIATIGDVTQNLAKFSAGDRQVDIRVQLDQTARADLATFENLRVRRGAGESVPLTAVADVRFGQGPTALDRYDRDRRVAIEGDLAPGVPLGEALDAVKALPEAKNLPAGVTLKEFGDVEIMREVFQGFAIAMAAGVLLVFAVLVLLFADVAQPVTILLSLPLSIGGALVALWFANESVSMPVVIGFLMLMGIVTKNAILLVDFAIEEVARGVERTTALIEAGRKRAQPIVMTTVAMTAGMVPSALALGEGGSFRAPMAIAVIGGLIASTVLSLVFVPAAYTILDDVRKIFSWMFGRFVGETDEPEEPPLPLPAPPQRLRAAE